MKNDSLSIDPKLSYRNVSEGLDTLRDVPSEFQINDELHAAASAYARGAEKLGRPVPNIGSHGHKSVVFYHDELGYAVTVSCTRINP